MDNELRKLLVDCYNKNLRKIGYGSKFKIIRKWDEAKIQKNIWYLITHYFEFCKIPTKNWYYDTKFKMMRQKPIY